MSCLMRTPFVAVAALTILPIAGFAQTVKSDSSHLVVPLRRDGIIIETVLGDPKVAGAPYVLRIRNDNNFFVFPHTHPENEHVVVLEGIWHLGSGPRFDRAKLRPLRPGDFTLIPRQMPHFAWSEGATIIQVHGIGPFRVDFVDPAFLLSREAPDSSATRHFRFRVRDSVTFDGGRGVIRDGMASPANGLIQYLIQTSDGREIVVEERGIRKADSSGQPSGRRE